jgi:N-glycosylase/DNA lyase
MDHKFEEIQKLYEERENEIKGRLEDFKEVIKSDEKIFEELTFCICTPQSKATICWNAITSLKNNGLLYSGDEKKIQPFLNPVRFGETKSKRIIEARNVFMKNNKIHIREKILSFKNSLDLRNWLVENIKGIGMKESGHFIRNIGFDYDNQLAILDRHILKNLKIFGIINEIPASLTKKRYLEIENLMKDFSGKLKISLYELDLVLWSKETGKIFK